MRILFLHHAFPGPFRHLAEALAGMEGNSVLFASEFGGHGTTLPGVRRFMLERSKGPGRASGVCGLDVAVSDMLTACRRGMAAFASLMRLRKSGFIPHMICASAAMGNAFSLRDAFPESFLVIHADWSCRNPEGSENLPEMARARMRNLLQLNGLADCDLAVTAMQWQRRRFPDWIAARMEVFPPCVDTDFFTPGTVRGREECPELVTITGRGLEKLLALPAFAEGLRRLLAARPERWAALVASDAGPERLPSLLASLKAAVGKTADRLSLFGFLPPESYRLLLQAAAVHVCLLPPFAFSSGVLEGMSCGCPVAAADTEAVREVIRPGENGFVYPPQSLEGMLEAVEDVLARTDLAAVGAAARQTALERHSVQKTLKENRDRLLSRYGRWLKNKVLENTSPYTG